MTNEQTWVSAGDIEAFLCKHNLCNEDGGRLFGTTGLTVGRWIADGGASGLGGRAVQLVMEICKSGKVSPEDIAKNLGLSLTRFPRDIFEARRKSMLEARGKGKRKAKKAQSKPDQSAIETEFGNI